MASTHNQWVLVDQLNKDESGLLSIGEENYAGASVRKNLDPLGRDLLLEPIRIAAETGEEVNRVIHHRSGTYRVHAEPILSPTSKSIVACLAIYAAEGEELAERPKVGALEWKISFDGHIETAWNDDMFDLYELERTGPSPTGDMNQWVSQLIAPEDRARMKVTIDASLKSMNTRRYLVPYRIITRYGTANPGHKNLEVSGRVFPDPAIGGKWLRAITREVQEITPSPITPEFGDYQSSGMLRAVFDLASHFVLMAVDTSCWQTFMVSRSWDDYGLMAPRYGYLPHVIYPDDYRHFRDAVEASDPKAETTVRFLHTDGSYQPYTVRAASGHDRPESGRLVPASDRYVVVKVLPRRHPES